MGTAEHLHLKNDEKEANIMMNIVTVNAPLLSIFFVKTYRKNCFIFIHADKNIFRMQRVECLNESVDVDTFRSLCKCQRSA